MNPFRPNASSSATPPTTGGSTSGSVIKARSRRIPGKALRASTHASGTPMTSDTAVATVEVHKESCSAPEASNPRRVDQISRHGALTIRPASGSIRNAPATSAGASKGTGTDRDPSPVLVRRARSVGLSCDDVGVLTFGCSSLDPLTLVDSVGQGFWKPAAARTF